MCAACLGHPACHRHRVRIERRDVGFLLRQGISRLGDFGGSDAPRLGLEQQVDGAFAGLVPAAIGLDDQAFTRPR